MTLRFPSSILVEQRQYNSGVLAGSARFAAPRSLDLNALRVAREYHLDGSPRYEIDPAAHNRDIVTERGRIRGRCFDTATAKGLAIHFHGGGWALGSIYAQDRMLREISRRAALDVVSVEYPLAPETDLREIMHTCRAALSALLHQNRGRSIVLIGESAGAHLALESLLSIRNQGENIDDIRALVLSYGIYDLGMTPSQLSWGPRFLGLSTPWLEYFYELALPGLSRKERRSPTISPLYADLAAMPPALLTVGTLDPLLDDSVNLHHRWLAAGNVGRIDIYPDAGHGFNHAPTAMASHANAAICTFLSEQLAQLPPRTPR